MDGFIQQLLNGLMTGSLYALVALGYTMVYGILRIINFAHGAQYMLGAFAAVMGLNYLGVNYWMALVLAPLLVGVVGVLIERFLLRRIAGEDHLYGLLLTFGLALILEGSFVKLFGVSGASYPMPEQLKGGYNLGFMFLPTYRAWVIVAALAVCLVTWFMIERTRLGSYLRAGTENPKLMQAFGINVPLLMTPTMGANLLIVVFAVVVIGGMGSIMGAIVTGLAMGLIEGLTKVFYPEAANTVVFLVMVLVLLVRPAGLFGKEA